MQKKTTDFEREKQIEKERMQQQRKIQKKTHKNEQNSATQSCGSVYE